MSDQPTNRPEQSDQAAQRRCPSCDSVVPKGAERCLMCGAELAPVTSEVDNRQHAGDEPAAKPRSVDAVEADVPEVFEAVMEEHKSRSLLWLSVVIVLLTFGAGVFLLATQDAQVSLAMVPTLTSIPSTSTYTPTWTPLASETSPPTETPTPTSTPVPTDTPRPPRFHSVASGETLFGLSLYYRISAESIAEENGIPLTTQIQVGQQLVIPWPTATPPLESLMLEVNEETIVADVTNCEIVVIEAGDSIYGLSAQRNVPAEAIIAVNRLTEDTMQMLQPGDTLCVPKITYGDTLPATPGPSPTATATSFPAGPSLLYPVAGTVIEELTDVIALQWAAVKDLADDEWYMVELTDMDVLDAMPHRAFTRDNAFRIPDSWRPIVPEMHQMRWRVSIVKVTGEREDGGFIYSYGGRSSDDAYFTWLGAVPTATPTLTPTATVTPPPSS